MPSTTTQTGKKMPTIKCSSCTNGKIQIFSHVEGGACFSCNGKGLVEIEETAQSHYKSRAEKAVIRILNCQKNVSSMSGYEDYYRFVCLNMKIEIDRDLRVLEEVATFCGEDFVNDLFIKSSDCF